jgi:hypothetical protein
MKMLRSLTTFSVVSWMIVATSVLAAPPSDSFLPTSFGPYSVVSADLNGDGYPDLVIPCRGELLSPEEKRPANDKVTIYLTNGSPDLVTRRDVTVGFGPYTAVIGDLDGDGLPDVVVANFQSNDGRDLSILYGSKDRKKAVEDAVSISITPRHLPYVNRLTKDGKPPYATPGLTSVAIADLNHDGKPDIVVVAWSVDMFFVFINDGNRRFHQISYPLSSGPRDVAVGDFNQDGNLDLAFTLYSSNQVQVWTGDGTGRMTHWQTFYSQGDTPYRLKAADVDRDGRLDLVVGHEISGNAAVFHNEAGGFRFIGNYKPDIPKGSEGVWSNNFIRDEFVTDWNHDGVPDLVFPYMDLNKVVFWEGTGDITFGKMFTHPKVLSLSPHKGPRGILPFGDGFAVVFHYSNEVGLIHAPAPEEKHSAIPPFGNDNGSEQSGGSK